MNKNIENLANKWNKGYVTLLTSREYSLEQVENLLRETYKVCTEYCNKDSVPKELCKVFATIQWCLSRGSTTYNIDEFTTSSDRAEYDAIAYIVDEIEYGFYTGEYICAYPQLSVGDSNGKEHILNMENAFLEELIDANR
ncbi:MAG: hypothetical protein IKU15_08555 [Clostridia bacterium]|nr:hypothetical protein [Clostridia bacterium]